MRTVKILPPCNRTAVFSRCGRYRYVLGRRWCWDAGQVVWIMLNPSKADDAGDDPTIRRCMSFSQAWGYGGMTVVNLYALRATEPKELVDAADPVGPDNDAYVAETCAASEAGAVVAAWGAHPLARARAGDVLSIAGRDINCLGLTGSGYPRHPLYVPAKQPRVTYFRPVACMRNNMH